MKLAKKYNNANLLTSLVILMITAISYYVVIHFILTDKLDRDLVIEEKEIQAYVSNYGRLPAPGDFLHQKVTYTKLGEKNVVKRKFLYEDFYNEITKKMEPGRSLITSIMLGKTNYQVAVSKSRAESEDLVRLIFVITLAVTLLLLCSLALINRFVLQQIWKPFYATLGMMKAFNIVEKGKIVAQKTDIDEFAELNAAVTTMTERVKKDYKELRNFTDNASHEMMTPLAIVNTKLDLLLQGKPLDEAQGKLIDEIYQAIGKLGRLNHTLLLLAKIENGLLPEQEQVDLKDLIVQKVVLFHEMIDSKNLNLVQHLGDKTVVMSKYLADILINNLLSNAIRHNFDGGVIHITLDQHTLVFSNTGKNSTLDASRLFERFNKTPESDGTGLGLAIVNQIVAKNNYHLTYHFEEHLHIFKVTF